MRALSFGIVVTIGVCVLILVGWAGPAHRGADVHTGDTMPPSAAPQPARTDADVLSACAGRYRLAGPPEILDATGETLIVTSEDGRLFIAGQQGKPELVPESGMAFRVPQYGTTVTFVKDEEGRVNQITVNLMGWKELSATRIE